MSHLQQLGDIGVQFEQPHPPPSYFKTNSTIIPDSKYDYTIKQWLAEKGIGATATLNLLYRGSVHGKRAADFHALCDNKGPTITLVRCAGGNVFGGFNPKSWTSYGSYNSSAEVPSAFVFSLINPKGAQPQKFDVKPGHSYAVRSGASSSVHYEVVHGPVFGGGVGGHDIEIGDKWNGCNSVLGNGYTTAGEVDPDMFTGARNFTPADVEVWQVQVVVG
jgi:hypothetical protein